MAKATKPAQALEQPETKLIAQTATTPFISVKDHYKDEVVGFNNSGAPLGQRDDLIILAEFALTVNPGLKEFFEVLPTLEELQAEKTRLFLEKTK